MNHNIRQKLYHWLTRQDPEITGLWQNFRRNNPGRAGLVKGLAFLLALRIPLLARHLGAAAKQNPAHLVLRESGRAKRPSQREWIRKLSACDVISFDAFDTLLLRPVEDPRDLFYFVGQKLSCPDFRTLRIRAEEEARQKNLGRGGCGEVTLEEIWEILAAQTGLDAQEGLRAEWETERQFCYANPLFLPVLAALRRMGKTLVIASDMYLGEERIRRLLFEAGLGEFDGCFVSCDRKASKHEGTLFDQIQKRFGSSCRYLHVGDHPQADDRMAREKGWEAVWVASAHETGRPFRVRRMSPVVGTMYRGLASQRLHGEGRRYSPLYEFGYLYGGLFAVGFCRFLHKRVKEKKIGRLLFLARDGEIFHKVYRLLYPDCDTRYVYWSRRAALKLSVDGRRQEYFQRFLRDKQNGGYTVEACLAAMDLSALLPGFVRETGWMGRRCLRKRRQTAVRRILRRTFPLWRRLTAGNGKRQNGMWRKCFPAAAGQRRWTSDGREPAPGPGVCGPKGLSRYEGFHLPGSGGGEKKRGRREAVSGTSFRRSGDVPFFPCFQPRSLGISRSGPGR